MRQSEARSEGVTAILATDDPVLIDLADRAIELSDGCGYRRQRGSRGRGRFLTSGGSGDWSFARVRFRHLPVLRAADGSATALEVIAGPRRAWHPLANGR